MSLFIILGIAMHLAMVSHSTGDLIDVETKSGIVRGKIVTGVTQKDARAFYGIPYAEPPIRKLRFRAPVPVTPWSGVFDATSVPLPCYQQYTKDSLKHSRWLKNTVWRPWSEDCLTLNIWTPINPLLETPVAIMFHSGDFMTGSGAYPHFDLATSSAEGELVYVSMNYRLGAFGFLTLGVPEFPGNLGLMDQHLALKWIHENVARFGGKKSAIFLIGFEAGSASIGHQVILPENEGLFKTAILHNGSPTCDWAWQPKENAVRLAKHLSRNLGCETSDLTKELECLQSAHPEDILDACFTSNALNTEHFRPNIDGVFIKERPDQAMEVGRFNNVTIIGSFSFKVKSLRFLAKNEDLLKVSGNGLTTDGFQKVLKRGGLADTKTEQDLIYNWYLGDDCSVNETYIRDAAIDAYSDGLTICCAEKFLEFASQNGVLTFKFVLNEHDPRFPDWIGTHDQFHFMLCFTPHVINPKNNYSSEIAQSSLMTLRAAGTTLRLKATEFEQKMPRFNLVDRSYALWSQEPQILNNHRKEECVLCNEILPGMRKRRGSQL